MEENINVCIKCGVNDNPQDAEFCYYCGIPLINRCLVESCKHVCQQYAVRCNKCGGETLYHQEGLARGYDDIND